MKKNVLLCAVNSKYIHSSLAVYCLKSCVNMQKFNCSVYESTINEKTDIQLDEITQKSPDIIGFSCYIWNITRILALCTEIKKFLPCCTIILGGPQVSYNSAQILHENPSIDFIICGEGERPFPHLLECIEKNIMPSVSLGITFRTNTSICEAEPFISDEITSSPYDCEYINSLHDRIAYIESARGCPFSCAFCLSGRCGKVRLFDMDRIKNEILLLANSGTKTVKFVDRTFNANKTHAMEILSFIIKCYHNNKISHDVCFHFEIGGDLLDEEMLTLLSDAPCGLFQLEIGFQSFNEKTLSAVNRKTDTKKLYKNVTRLIAFANMHIHTDLIAGLPYEDMKSFEQTFNKAYSMGANMLQMGFLKLLHGAAMREETDKYPCEYSKEPPYEVISTPYMSADDLRLLHITEDALERLYNSGRFRRSLSYLIQECKIEPFTLFTSFGQYAKNKENKSLDEYTALFLEFFSIKENVSSALLRDLLVCDRLCTNKSGKLPFVLKCPDERFKAIKKAMLSRGIASCALLCSTDDVVYANYNEQSPVSGEYKLYRESLKDIIN